MGHLSALTLSHPRRSAPWARVRRRAWVRPNDLASVTRLFAVIPSLPRAELSRLTTRMIDRIDEIDGDPDLEDLRDDDEDGADLEKETPYA